MTDNAYSVLAFTELSENPAWKEKLGELAAKIAETDKAKAAAVEAQKIIDRAGQMQAEVVALRSQIENQFAQTALSMKASAETEQKELERQRSALGKQRADVEDKEGKFNAAKEEMRVALLNAGF
jgi:hypothetical protein